MEFHDIERTINGYTKSGKKVFTTSSFQSHSIPLLHIISEIDNSIPIVFINTGYHFPETIQFRDDIAEKLRLNVVDLRSEVPRINQRGADGRLLFVSDPDQCCFVNKTQPMEKWLMKYDIWINGVRADQSMARKSMKVEQNAPHGVTRFHPMLDWNPKKIFDYRKAHNLPDHPLESKGYLSIGCEPCTRKIDPEMMEREARWFGLNKTDCGLHSELIKK